MDKQGEAISDQDTCRTSLCIGDYEKAFTLIIQRTAVKGQVSLDLESQHNPEDLAQHRAMTLRWRLYAMAAKVVKTERQLFVKLKEKHRILLEQVLLALKEFEPPPI